jgi:hypothetical protein
VGPHFESAVYEFWRLIAGHVQSVMPPAEPAEPARRQELQPLLAVGRAERVKPPVQMPPAEPAARAEPQALSPPLAAESAEWVGRPAQLSLRVVERAEPAGRPAQMQMPPAEPAARVQPRVRLSPLAAEHAES